MIAHNRRRIRIKFNPMKFRDSYFFFLKQDPFFLKYLVGFRGTETISDGWYSGV